MGSGYFFSPGLSLEVVCGGRNLRIGSVRAEDRGLISEGLSRMSPESIRNRFLASKRGFTDEELSELTELDGKNHYAIGVEEVGANRGIAVIRLARSLDDPLEAEVAITVIDGHQKQGLGTLLLSLLILAAAERGIARLSFTFLPTNEGIQKLVSKFGHLRIGTNTRDTRQMLLDMGQLDLGELMARLKPCLPEIGNFHLET